jgi:glycosyltransferase involved in cell wall biosynthesis
MRIVLFTRYDPFKTRHGTEIFGKNLAIALADAGHEIHLVFGSTPARLVLNDGERGDERLHSHLISHQTSQVVREAEYMLRTRFSIQGILRDISPTVVIGVGAGQGLVFEELRQRSSRPALVYYAMDCMAQEGNAIATLLNQEKASLWKRTYNHARYYWLEQADRESCRNADFIVATSRNTKDSLSRYYGVSEDKVVVNYLGIPDNYADGFSRSFPRVPSFFHIATSHERKGTTYLLKALRSLKESYPGPLHSIIRGAPDPRYLLQSEGLDVTFAPSCDVRQIYASCTALVVPSVSEGFCLPVVEAGAFGKPAIVSSAGSLPELVSDEESGYVVSVGDSEKLAQRIREFSDDTELVRRMGQKALEHSRNFRISDSARNLIRIIETYA